jgi:hypothetical protein
MSVKVQFSTYRWNINEAGWTLAKQEVKEFPDRWQAHRATLEFIRANPDPDQEMRRCFTVLGTEYTLGPRR